MNHDYIKEQLAASAEVKRKIASECTDQINAVAGAILTAFRGGHKLLICGNGGSAADAQHMAAELVIRMARAARPALPAIALTTDTSALTAGGNDLGFEQIFSRQVEALGAKADVLIGISTSGNSPNVIRAMAEARSRGMVTIGLLGKGGGKLKPLCDHAVLIPSEDIQRIQEGHITVAHVLCGIVESTLFGTAK